MIKELKNIYRSKKILVTGGAGAIGINLITSLLDLEVDRIIIIDNLSSGNASFIPKDSRIHFLPFSLENKEKLESYVPNDIDYVFHLAAHFANQNSVDFPVSDALTNIIGSINLLEIIRNKKIAKFVNCSSSCVYGNSSEMFETDNVYPTDTPYAINKLVGELYTRYYHEKHLVPTVNIRIFNTFGPFELHGDYRNAIPNFIYRAINNLPINITGTGQETRDFTYVQDTVELMLLAGSSEVRDGSVFNGGTGVARKIIDVVEHIIGQLNSKSKIVFKDRRDWDIVEHRKANIERSNNHLGYQPKHSDEDFYKNLNSTIHWHENLHLTRKNDRQN